MRRVAPITAVLIVSAAHAQDAPSSWGQAVPVDAADAGEVRSVIGRQLRAFRQHDDTGAYAVTAPSVRRRFQTSTEFMVMARSGYGPLLTSTGERFGAIRGAAATPTSAQSWNQTATVVTATGETWTATYGLEREPDGTVRITSCVLVRDMSGTT